jgi:predicted O-methyltransferase YrrM
MSKKSSSKADQLLNEIADIAVVEFLPIVGPAKGKILVDEVRKAKPKNVLEVGTFIGYSTIMIGRELEKTAKFVTVEEHLDEAEVAKDNIRQSELPIEVQVIAGDAVEVIPTLACCFDFVFLDAAKDEYFQYLKLVEDKLWKGAVIVADNAGKFAAEMKEYLDYVRKSGKFSSRYVGVGNDGLEISVKL